MILLYVFLFSGSLQGNSWEVDGHTIRQTALRWAVLIGVSLRVSPLTQPLTFAPLHSSGGARLSASKLHPDPK